MEMDETRGGTLHAHGARRPPRDDRVNHLRPRVSVSTTAESAASEAAAEIARRARTAVADRGTFTLAISGGRSPWTMLAHLADLDMPWADTTIFQVDERVGAADDPQRNLTGLLRSLPPDCPAAVVPMPVEADDLDAACAAYAAVLPVVLDLIHLGLGSDGHTASLVPGDPVLDATEADVALTGSYQGRRRMTLTYPRIARARALLWLVTGPEKRASLAQLLAHDQTIPAGRVTNPDQVVFCDSRWSRCGPVTAAPRSSPGRRRVPVRLTSWLHRGWR
jgi:6-phosphogluconolactonase